MLCNICERAWVTSASGLSSNDWIIITLLPFVCILAMEHLEEPKLTERFAQLIRSEYKQYGATDCRVCWRNRVRLLCRCASVTQHRARFNIQYCKLTTYCVYTNGNYTLLANKLIVPIYNLPLQRRPQVRTCNSRTRISRHLTEAIPSTYTYRWPFYRCSPHIRPQCYPNTYIYMS